MSHKWVDYPTSPHTWCEHCGTRGGVTSSDECWIDLSLGARSWMEQLGAFVPTIHDANREVKGMLWNEDEGTASKAYLHSRDLRMLALACVEVADWLDRRAERALP